MKGRPQPSREETVRSAQVRIEEHPIIDVLMTTLRDKRTESLQFSSAVEELARYLLWRSLMDMQTESVEVPGHSGALVQGKQIAPGLAGLVILRAGLGMAQPMRNLLPRAPVYQVGVRRNEENLQPEVYYINLPSQDHSIKHMIILDSMLATGGSATAAIRALRETYTGMISFVGLIGAPLGVRALINTDPTIRIRLAALDDGLDERGFIIPGLGDAGDRLFGTS